MCAKKQPLKSYNWELIIWAEHFENDDINLELRIKISDNIHVPCLLSPKHDQDRYTDGEQKGELKKPHWHLLMSFDNQKTKNQLTYLDEMFNEGSGNNLNIVLSRGGATRYLTHDGYEIPGYKFRYPTTDVQQFGGADYKSWFSEASGQKIEIIFKMIRENEINSYPMLLAILSEDADFHYLLEEATRKAFAIQQYIQFKFKLTKSSEEIHEEILKIHDEKKKEKIHQEIEEYNKKIMIN